MSLAGVVLALLGSGAASAITIGYEVTNISGNDYRYDYTVINDGSLGAGVPVELFDILFDTSLYDELSLSIVSDATLAPDWDEQIIASFDPFSPALYDAYALGGGIADGTEVSGFAVSFTWLGNGAGPGPQAFEIYDPFTFDLVETGTTVRIGVGNPVPEPSAALLFGGGALILSGHFRRSTIPS